jgi:hypothetical protein
MTSLLLAFTFENLLKLNVNQRKCIVYIRRTFEINISLASS